MWYAMQVISGSEALVSQLCMATVPSNLLKKCFYPRYESYRKHNGIRQIVTRNLFPGYLFLDTDHIEQVEKLLWQIPELTKVLKVGQTSIPINPHEQQFIDEHSNQDYIFTMSKGYMQGDFIHVEEGAFAGYYGKLLFVDRHNRYGIMQIQMFGKTIEMQFGLEVVKKE